jgi:hypothetical protein
MSNVGYLLPVHAIASGHFESDGWCSIPTFIDAGELESARIALSEALSAPRQSCARRPGNHLVLLRWLDRVVGCLLGSKRRIAQLRELTRAADLRWLSGYASIKPPYSPPLWWHQDWWCWNHPVSFERPAAQVAVLCYLTDTSESNGALRILPGSHRRSTSLHAALPEAHAQDVDNLPFDHPAMRDSSDQVTASVRAGDAVVLDYRLLHGTHPNGTPEQRSCILLSFFPNWRALPSELQAHCALHPALPSQDEHVSGEWCEDLLPRYSGTPADFGVDRVPPANFCIC